MLIVVHWIRIVISTKKCGSVEGAVFSEGCNLEGPVFPVGAIFQEGGAIDDVFFLSVAIFL